jgi:hypothetical protein
LTEALWLKEGETEASGLTASLPPRTPRSEFNRTALGCKRPAKELRAIPLPRALLVPAALRESREGIARAKLLNKLNNIRNNEDTFLYERIIKTSGFTGIISLPFI